MRSPLRDITVTGMATNTDSTTTYAPGTVKGTVRVTATGLRPGMRIRLTGDRAKSSRYRSDVDGTELHGTALILSVESELRGQKSYRSKRSRWYVVTLSGGQKVSLAPASRHDVTADSTGAPLLESMDHVETVTAADNAIRWSATTDASRAQVERYGRTLDGTDLRHLVDDCMENATDELGPEPTDSSTVESATWWSHLALSIWSEADARGVDLDAAPAPAPHVVEILDEIHAEQAATEPEPAWDAVEPAPFTDPRRDAILASLKATTWETATEIARRAGVASYEHARQILDQLVDEGLAQNQAQARHGAPPVTSYRRPPTAGRARPTDDLNRSRLVWSLQHATEPEPVSAIAGRARVNPGVASQLLEGLVADGAVCQTEGHGRVPHYHLPRTTVILAQELQVGDVVVTVGPRGYARRRSIGMVHVDHSHGVVTYEADREGPWRIPTDWPLTVALPRLIPPA